jgi:hypothetical protein
VSGVSLAAITPPAAIYREEQTFGWWVYALLAVLIVALAGLGLGWAPQAHPGPTVPVHAMARDVPLGLVFGLTLPAVLVVGVLRMITEVTPAEVRVWFGWLPTYRRVVPIDAIKGVEVVRYRPIADYGGWGIRRGRDGERVLNARGDRGVRLSLTDGTRLLIGSQRPEELAAALKRAMQPVL